MHYTIDIHPGHIKAEMRERETGEETRGFVEAIIAALRQHKLARLLISVRSSRPVFKVEQYGLSEALAQVADMGLRVAFIADSKEVGMSQQYIALLGQQRGLDCRTFDEEQDAVAWLLAKAP
jgi:hypothetical protein